MWHCIQLWNPDPDTVLMPENKTSHFPASIPACQILQTAGAWSPIICVLYNSSRVWGRLKGFTPFHFTPQPLLFCFPVSRCVLPHWKQYSFQCPHFFELTVQAHSFLINQDVTSGQGSSTIGDMEKVAGKHLSLQVFCSLAVSQTPPVGQKQGAGQHPQSDPMWLSSFMTWGLVIFFPVRAYVRASLFLSDVSSCHAETLPPILLHLHRSFRGKSRTFILRRMLSFPWWSQGCIHFWFHFFCQGHYFCW